MPKKLTCPDCGKTLKLPPDSTGKRARCPQCKAVVTIPASENGPDESFTPSVKKKRPPLPGNISSGEKPKSRYLNHPAAQGTTDSADCVIHLFDCLEDENYGREMSIAIRDLLRKDGTFQEVLVTENTDVTGGKVTVEEGAVSKTALEGGLLKKAHCIVAGSATVFNAQGESESTSQTAQQPQGNLKAMLKVNTKAVSTKIARDTLRHGTGVRRLKQEVSALATASMCFGIFSFIPFAGFLLALFWLILAIVTMVYNKGRTDKIGYIRIGIGLLFVIIGIVLSIYFINLGTQRRGRF
jgi:hypothetical protein